MSQLLASFRAAFAAFVALGGGIILAFSLPVSRRALGAQAQWIMLAAVLALMLLFAVLIALRARQRLATDSDAEAFYYLGFIYTLITLVGTFTPLLLDGEKPSTQAVLGLFGLGLITTFVGLAGRIFFLQSDAPALERAPDRLAQACAEAARQLESITLQLAKATSEVERTIVDSHTRLAASAEKTNEQIARTAEQAQVALHQTLEGLASKVASTLDEAVGKTSRAVENVGARLAALKLPEAELGDALRSRLVELTRSVEGVATSMSLVRGNADALQVQLTEVGTNVQDVSVQAGGLSRMLHALTEAAAGNVAVSKTLQDSTKKLDDAFVLASGATDALQSSISACSPQTQAFGASFESMNRSAAVIGPTLSGATDAVLNFKTGLAELLLALESSRDVTQELVSVQKGASQELVVGVDVLRKYQDHLKTLASTLDDDLKASELAVRKVHNSLVTAASALASKVQ